MSWPGSIEEVRDARAGRVAAKVGKLRGKWSSDAEFPGHYLMLDGLRIMRASGVGYPKVSLVPRSGGFALCLQISHGPRVWLIAERSKRVRIFKHVETALVVCKELGADQVVVVVNDLVPPVIFEGAL